MKRNETIRSNQREQITFEVETEKYLKEYMTECICLCELRTYTSVHIENVCVKWKKKKSYRQTYKKKTNYNDRNVQHTRVKKTNRKNKDLSFVVKLNTLTFLKVKFS